jgi:hypothetical protein
VRLVAEEPFDKLRASGTRSLIPEEPFDKLRASGTRSLIPEEPFDKLRVSGTRSLIRSSLPFVLSLSKYEWSGSSSLFYNQGGA